MKHTITGCLVKYGETWWNGKTVVLPGAFEEDDGKKIPIISEGYFATPDDVIGRAELEKREDGIWFTAELNDTEAAEKIFQEMQKEKWFIGLYANRVQSESRADGSVWIRGGKILSGHPTKAIDNASWIETLDGEPYLTEKEASDGH